MNRPVHELLTAQAARQSWHMPGHKGEPPFGDVPLYALDTTETPVTDDLYHPTGALAQAQQLYAQAAGAGASLFLHNGATAGVHTLLGLWTHPGDTVLLPRNAHLSALNACVLWGLKPVWIPVTVTADGYPYAAEESVLAAIRTHPEAKALLLTRPDYEGGCIPLRRIVPAAHAAGIRVAVDEAHGAHLPWADAPHSAGAEGADGWVQSVHKTLPGLTGAAVLHLREGADAPRALTVLRRTQTSSPSFLLMRSIDDARAWMQDTGADWLRTVTAALAELRLQLPGWGYRDAHADWVKIGYAFDPTRLVITAPQGGESLAASLAERGMDVEMYDDRRAVCIVTAMDAPERIAALGRALAEIPAEAAELPPVVWPERLPEQAIQPRDAALGEVEWVPLSRAAGRIAAHSAGLYPPGIPLVCPGEIIDRDTAALLADTPPHRRFGLEGENILCAR